MLQSQFLPRQLLNSLLLQLIFSVVFATSLSGLWSWIVSNFILVLGFYTLSSVFLVLGIELVEYIYIYFSSRNVDLV